MLFRSSGDNFGAAVALAGETALIGAPDDGDLGAASGSAYVFTHGAGSFHQDAKLVVAQGAELLVDGRGAAVEGYPKGYWLGPTILRAEPGMDAFDRELFGPVRCVKRVSGLDEALDIINRSTYGHTAAIYTEQGGVAREFRQRAEVGQIGVKIGRAHV